MRHTVFSLLLVCALQQVFETSNTAHLSSTLSTSSMKVNVLKTPAGQPSVLNIPNLNAEWQRRVKPMLPGGREGPALATPADEISALQRCSQIIIGAAAIFGLDRLLWAASTAANLKIPTAPVGMLLIFVGMLLIDAISPQTAIGIKDWFTPARMFYSNAVPLFLAPPLVQLPLSLGRLTVATIVKYLVLVSTGTVASVIVSGLAVNAFVACLSPAGPKLARVKMPVPVRSKSFSVKPKMATIMPIFCPKVAIASMFILAALQMDSLLIVYSSIVALQAARCLPVQVQAVFPAIIPSAMVTSAVVCFLGKWRGVDVSAALKAYRNGLGGAFGGTGIGDLMFCGSAPAITALGFSLFEQRQMLSQNLLPLICGASMTVAFSLFFTATMCKLIRLDSDVGLCLLTRSVSMSMAVPVVETFKANLGLAAAALVIQGSMGAALGRKLLDLIGVTNDLARGIAIGGTAHTLGAAAAASSEPTISPSCAVTFLFTGSLLNILVNIGWFRSLIHLLFKGYSSSRSSI